MHDPDVYVDTKEMLDTFSKDIHYIKLPRPYTQTLFVELMKFTPGQPEGVHPNGGPSGSATPRVPPIGPTPSARSPAINGMLSLMQHRPGPPPMLPPPRGPSSASHGPSSPATPFEQRPPLSASAAGPHHVPPPPWSNGGSRWSNAAVTAPPPTAKPHTSDAHTAAELSSIISRKRKQPDESGPNDEIMLTQPGPSSLGPALKRRPTQSPVNHTHMPPMDLGHMQPVAMAGPSPMMTLPMRAAPPGMPQPVLGFGVTLPPLQPGPSSLRTPPMPSNSAHPLRTPPMPSPSARPTQGLSPSLAMMLSPSAGSERRDSIHTSPPRASGSGSRDPVGHTPPRQPPYPGRINIGPPPSGLPPLLPEDHPLYSVRSSIR